MNSSTASQALVAATEATERVGSVKEALEKAKLFVTECKGRVKELAVVFAVLPFAVDASLRTLRVP